MTTSTKKYEVRFMVWHRPLDSYLRKINTKKAFSTLEAAESFVKELEMVMTLPEGPDYDEDYHYDVNPSQWGYLDEYLGYDGYMDSIQGIWEVITTERKVA